jgi:hypothetical protein
MIDHSSRCTNHPFVCLFVYLYALNDPFDYIHIYLHIYPHIYPIYNWGD